MPSRWYRPREVGGGWALPLRSSGEMSARPSVRLFLSTLDPEVRYGMTIWAMSGLLRSTGAYEALLGCSGSFGRIFGKIGVPWTTIAMIFLAPIINPR